MATKQQVIKAIEAKGGKLIDDSDRYNWQIHLEAPEGRHWDECHSRPIFWHPTGKKSDFWDEVLEEIELLESHPCTRSSWCTQDFGECEFWGKV